MLGAPASAEEPQQVDVLAAMPDADGLAMPAHVGATRPSQSAKVLHKRGVFSSDIIATTETVKNKCGS